MNEAKQRMQQIAEKEYAYRCNKVPIGIGQEANVMGGRCGEYRQSPAEEAEKRAYSLAQESDKARQAAEFLRAHPEFDEFIHLIRKGVIGI